MRVLSLFSGIGAYEKALKNLGVDVDLVAYCEIDKKASKAYSAVHGVSEDKNLWDVTKVDTSKLPRDIDLVTYSYPCQDLSMVGRQRGFFDGENLTRSGLFFEAWRIINDLKPKYAISENVKTLVGKKFEKEFGMVCEYLDKAGYNNYWKVMDAKDYGTPQHRERVIMVSIRKDIDKGFVFPEPEELKVKFRDLLEDNVEGYDLKKSLSLFVNNSFKQEANGNGFRFIPYVKKNAEVARTITTKAGGRMDDNFVIDVDVDVEKIRFDSKNPLLRIDNGEIYVGGKKVEKVRMLTERECWRLMGFDDEDFDKAKAVVCKTDLYHQAGNSVVVSVLERAMKGLV